MEDRVVEELRPSGQLAWHVGDQRLAAHLVAAHRGRVDRITRTVWASDKREPREAPLEIAARIDRSRDGAVQEGIGERYRLAPADQPGRLVIRGQLDGDGGRGRAGEERGDACDAHDTSEESGHGSSVSRCSLDRCIECRPEPDADPWT